MRALLATVLALSLAACGEQAQSTQASYEDQQLCLNKAERTYERITGRDVSQFFDTDAYYSALKDCRDGKFRMFPADTLREERAAEEEAERKRAQQELNKQEAARQEQEENQREAALKREFDRLGCGEVDAELSAADAERCDELMIAAP